MPVLLPFRAQIGTPDSLYVPGEEKPATLPRNCSGSGSPALFLYRQRFSLPGELSVSTRIGVIGVLAGETARVLPHERTIPAHADAIRSSLALRDHDPGPLWLWCNDPSNSLEPLIQPDKPAHISAADRFGCIHEYWKIECPGRIARLQHALEGRRFFIADGHHRYESGWRLSVIQIRNGALRSLGAHRLIRDKNDIFTPPSAQPVREAERYLATAPEGRRRFVLYASDCAALGFESNDSAACTGRWLQSGTPARDLRRVVEAVDHGDAPAALLVSPPSIDRIEQDAHGGILLPPKSTDFFPKLAAGVVIHRD